MKKIIQTFIFVFIVITTSTANAEPKTYMARGAIIGGVSGLAVGGIIGLSACAAYNPVRDAEDAKAMCNFFYAPIAAGSSAVVGALIGGAIGYNKKRKQPVVQVTVDPKTKTYGAGMSMTF